MATTTMSGGRSIRRGRWLVAGVVVVILAILAALALSNPPGQPAAGGPTTVAVSRGAIVASVTGSGSVAAAQSIDLPFQTNGTVVAVLVAEGDAVQAGQVLARLDSRDLELQVASAEAELERARVQLSQTQSGNVKPAEIEAQEAAVASAQAQLASAQAQLAALRNPSADAISSAETAVRQAELTLQAERDNSSANKTKAEQDLRRAVDSLTQAQVSYATAKGNWDFVQETGQDPTNPETTNSEGDRVANKLNDTQRQQYYDTFAQAEAALRSAEVAVQQAQVTYDNARQAEPNTIQQAEASLADAQAQLVALRNPSATDIAQAQASVDQARASLNQARANLANLTAPGTESDIAIQQVAVTQAEQSLAQARLQLEQAELRAPFDGVVTGVNIVTGGAASSASAAVSLLDRDPLHVDLKLSENDVAEVQLGMPVALTIDALDDWSTEGTVTYIAQAAESSSGVVTYDVRVSFPDGDERVRVGMTANLAITTDQKEDVLLVPNSALLPKGAGRVVQVPNAEGRGVTEVEVQTGLTDGVQTEVLSGLSEGDRIIATPSSGEPQRPAGPFGG
jgi:HlyD family secretion protein